MATELQMGGVDEDRIFLDTDNTRDFEILDGDDNPIDVSSYAGALTFDVRKEDKSSVIKLTKAASVVGIYNSVRATNTQRIRVVLLDTELTIALFGSNGGTYRYSLKYTAAGVEQILAYGDIVIQRATQAA